MVGASGVASRLGRGGFAEVSRGPFPKYQPAEMAALAASMAGRSTILRTLCRASANSAPRRPSLAVPLRTSNSSTPRSSVANSSPIRLLRRELSSFKPLHSAIASAYLVSKLPSEVTASSEGRFANYVSPI